MKRWLLLLVLIWVALDVGFSLFAAPHLLSMLTRALEPTPIPMQTYVEPTVYQVHDSPLPCSRFVHPDPLQCTKDRP